MKTWSTPWGDVSLSREPYDSDPALQAWNAADTLMASYVLRSAPKPDRPHLVYNDAFGALTVLLTKSGRAVTQVSDSALAQRATLWNLDANGLSDDRLLLLDSLTAPPAPKTTAEVPVVLVKLPKTHALLEWQLAQLKKLLPPGAEVVAGGMTRDVHSSTLEIFENILGPTRTSQAEQKARLIVAQVDRRPPEASTYPTTWALPGAGGWSLVNHASVFSRDGLDGGTRLLLKNFPRIGSGLKTVVDLGCGNGILGLAAAKRSPEAEVYCVDESFMAVWSARETFRLNELGGRGYFLAGDGLEDFAKGTVDLILCNPPFHFQNAQTLEIAWAMFDQARQVLKSGGELWVVANKHLGHHKSLADRFGTVATVAVDDRFVVLRARV